MKYDSYLWVEQVRPQTIDDMVIPKHIKVPFLKYREEKEIPHLMLKSNSPGTGKTSLAKAICNDIEADTLYINASSENGIDTLRSKVVKFASGRGLYVNTPKVIILDEMDGTTEQFQKALRPVMEEFANTCRFIITCNYEHKIIEAIKSRCQIYDFNFASKEIAEELKPKIVKRIKSVLKLNECEFDDGTITKLVDAFYPDIRKTINTLQQYAKINNNVIDESIFNFNTIGDEFYEFLLKKDSRGARKYIIESSINPDETYSNLYNEYLPLIEDSEIKYAQSLIIINDYQFKSAFSIDKELCLAACITELCSV